MSKKFVLLIVGMFFLFSFPSFVEAQASYCAERTTSGAWCQNVPFEEVDQDYRSAPTSCESTSFCKLGCCYDSEEGTCMRNTAEANCPGFWEDSATCDVPQCELGCCSIGNQAAFVSGQRCKRLSSVYSLETNFRTDISNELQCILSTTSDEEGACVFEEDFQTTCRFLTKRECLDLGASNVSFHEDFLCTAPELNTICAKTDNTVCVEGRDEVFFVDSCGNLANIYNSARVNDESYWREIVPKAESCGFGDSNSDSASCGNCDYFLGSTCKEFERGIDKVRPIEGDNICRDLSCNFEGRGYEHGETWCADSQGVESSLPGSRNFRMVCYNGEVSVEPCSDFRQGVCIESEIEGFSTAACRANRWQDCTAQDKKKDCDNLDKRDCNWIGGDQDIKCVPEFAPGFNFWTAEAEGEAEDICSSASITCTITCEEGFVGDPECTSVPEGCGDENGLNPSWEASMNNICTGIGDCGVSVNYIGKKGFNELGEDDE